MKRMFFERRLFRIPGFGPARTKSWGTILMAIWLIGYGLARFVSVTAFRVDIALAVLALVAGTVLLFERRP